MEYDLAIIGAGWAGFNAATKAKALGLKTCLIEKGDVGGTCLNLGCIPTKTLIQSAKIYTHILKAASFGIETQNPKINFNKIQERKDKIIRQLNQGMNFMLKEIDLIKGQAEFISNREIKIGEQAIKTKSIIIACGSKPTELPFLKLDGKKILSSNEILRLKDIPESMLIAGGGVIGCEFASLFSTMGAQVSIIERLPQLIPGMDLEVAKKLENILKRRGVKIQTNTDARKVDPKEYAVILVCVGRTAETENFGADKIGLSRENGKITVDEYLKTNIENIYAAGDCTGKIMLAHLAAYEGCLAVENIFDPKKPRKINCAAVPNCIFTDPEVATVGENEEEAKNKGTEIKIHRFDFLGSGMARILDETEGFIKIISDNKTEELIGCSIIGPRATELIGIMALAVSKRLKIAQIKDTIFAHPTLSESISEALK